MKLKIVLALGFSLFASAAMANDVQLAPSASSGSGLTSTAAFTALHEAVGRSLQGRFTDQYWATDIYGNATAGAKCDGATDDTLAINEAIRIASSNGGGTVMLPSGTCLYTQQVWRSNVKLKGQGQQATILQWKPTTTPVDTIITANFNTLTGTNLNFGDGQCYSGGSLVTAGTNCQMTSANVQSWYGADDLTIKAQTTTARTPTFTGSLTAGVLTVTAVTTGTLTPGMPIYGLNDDITGQTVLAPFGTGTGAGSGNTGTYTVTNCVYSTSSTCANTPQTVASETMYGQTNRVIATYGNEPIYHNVMIYGGTGWQMHAEASSDYAYNATDTGAEEEGLFENFYTRNGAAGGISLAGLHDPLIESYTSYGDSLPCIAAGGFHANYIHCYAEGGGVGVKSFGQASFNQVYVDTDRAIFGNYDVVGEIHIIGGGPQGGPIVYQGSDSIIGNIKGVPVGYIPNGTVILQQGGTLSKATINVNAIGGGNPTATGVIGVSQTGNFNIADGVLFGTTTTGSTGVSNTGGFNQFNGIIANWAIGLHENGYYYSADIMNYGNTVFADKAPGNEDQIRCHGGGATGPASYCWDQALGGNNSTYLAHYELNTDSGAMSRPNAAAITAAKTLGTIPQEDLVIDTAAITLTMPSNQTDDNGGTTGTLVDGALKCIINDDTSTGTVTVAAGTGQTLGGTATVAAGSRSCWKYRLSTTKWEHL